MTPVPPPTRSAADLRLLVAEHENRALGRALESMFLSGRQARTRLFVARHEQKSLSTTMSSMRAALVDVDTAHRDILGSRTFRGWAAVVGYERRRRRRFSGRDGKEGT